MRLASPSYRTSARALFALFVLLTGGLPADASAQSASERRANIEAAMIYNFARFARLPKAAFAGPRDSFRICTPEGRPLNDALRRLSEKTIDGRPVAIVEHAPDELPQDCHAALLPDEESARVAAGSSRRGVLLVATREGVGGGLAQVELVRLGRQTRFNVDLAAADAAEVELSSKLVHLAVRVR